MKFTRYYSWLLDAQGLPHLSIEQHKRLFNIVTLENRIDEVVRLKQSQRENELQYKCGHRIMILKDKLETLTEKKEPKEIIQNMLVKSQK